MEAPIYNSRGEETGAVTLSERVFGLAWNADLVHQVVTAMRANARSPVAHAKGRGEVRGGGRKPWRQKGTGRARHGSIRSPLWRGGGITHGPNKERAYEQKINKKMSRRALATVLSQKLRDGEMLFVDDLAFGVPKTKDAALTLSRFASITGFEKIAYKRGNRALIAHELDNGAFEKSFRNIASVAVTGIGELNPVNVLSYKYLVITHPIENIKKIEARLTSSK
ncbi:MAG: 50S ribosomal protein L4 [Candidatus Vogelbacteria bacterium]|nr:50S ribosomal protein L4 [Candidatus Vogelbacteria bacterium]